MERVSNKFSDNKREKVNFEKNGFVYVSDIDRFIFDGYGAWITNIDVKNKNIFSSYVKSSEWLKSLEDDGCELVVGPAAPADNGIVYGCSCGVYIKNYLERMKAKQVSTGKTKVSILRTKKDKNKANSVVDEKKNEEQVFSKDKVVSHAIRIANNLKTIQMHCGIGLNLGDIYDNAIDSVYAFEKETIEKYNDEELYSIIVALEEVGSESTISHMVVTLRDALFKRIMKPVEIPMTDQIIDLVSEAKILSERYSIISTHTRLGYNLNSEFQSAQDDISAFISKILTESDDSKIVYFVDIFEESYTKSRHCVPNGAQFIINSIKNDFQKKFLDSHFSEKVKLKEKK